LKRIQEDRDVQKQRLGSSNPTQPTAAPADADNSAHVDDVTDSTNITQPCVAETSLLQVVLCINLFISTSYCHCTSYRDKLTIMHIMLLLHFVLLSIHCTEMSLFKSILVTLYKLLGRFMFQLREFSLF